MTHRHSTSSSLMKRRLRNFGRNLSRVSMIFIVRCTAWASRAPYSWLWLPRPIVYQCINLHTRNSWKQWPAKTMLAAVPSAPRMLNQRKCLVRSTWDRTSASTTFSSAQSPKRRAASRCCSNAATSSQSNQWTNYHVTIQRQIWNVPHVRKSVLPRPESVWYNFEND